jgi:uncharacterized protein YkwD
MANPTAREQENLELINRMRMNPAAELPLLLNSSDPDIASSLAYFKVDLTRLRSQWSLLKAVAPLAWSSQLNEAAIGHNQKMIQYDQQSHYIGVFDSSGKFTPYELSFPARITATGYNFTYIGENIFAYATSTIENEAAWAIDWGGSAATGGIQDPPGHRDDIMSGNFREVGIAFTDETNPSTEVGPLVTTADFGNRTALDGKAWLLGVAFQDNNRDGWYEAGEGLADVQVKITGINGTTFSDTLAVGTAGGYQDLLNPGQYQVDFSRNGVVVSSKTTLISATTPANVKIDLALSTLTRNDFDGDNKSDILWRNTDGSVALWQINTSTVTPSSVGLLTSDWKIAGVGDFNGDRKSDMLIVNTNGAVVTWQMNGSTVTKTSTIGAITPDWKIAGTGDFNGDGQSDILFQNTNGTIAQWQMNGATVATAAIVGTPSPDWKVAGTGDFNGDGKSDVLLQNTNGTIALWQMNGATVAVASVIGTTTTDWKIAGIGDFNGDGNADILWRNTNGSVAQWQMNGGNVSSTSVIGSATADWKIAGTGDYNGDGNADILWRNDFGTVATWQLNGSIILAAGATSIPTAPTSWQIAAPIL